MVLCFVQQTSFGQSIPDDLFEWYEIRDCPDVAGADIYAKVEDDPRIHLGPDRRIQTILTSEIERMSLPPTASGHVKLKIRFLLGQSLCVHCLGVKDLDLQHSALTGLISALSSIDQLSFGRQRGREVHCQAILYLTIKEGALESFRNVNFVID